MCWPDRKMPTNQIGQATRLWLCHCQSIQIRVFHVTWFTFWLCFFGWFATANLYVQIKQDLGLSDVDKAIAGGCSVASTVVFRVIVGYLCDRIGCKKTYVILLICSSFPITGMALVQSPTAYIIVSLMIGIVGSSFVVTQVHTTAMFAGKTVGTANATTTGWGNFGGGCAAFFLPLLYFHFVEDYDMSNSKAWRMCMVIPGVSYILMAVIYWFTTEDYPPKPETTAAKPEPASTAAQTNTLDTEKEKVSEGSNFILGAKDLRTWILFAVYAGCFGIELTVLRFSSGYFMYSFGIDQKLAGFIVLCFSFCNLFARSIGGIIADVVSRFSEKSLIGRRNALFIILLIESVFLILFSLSTYVDNMGYTICMMIMFSLCVQSAEGATFAIVPFIQPKAIGAVAGIVGAGGNCGAMLYAFIIFINVPDKLSYFYAWLILGIIVFFISWTILFIRFSDEQIRSADEKMNTWNEMDARADGKSPDGANNSFIKDDKENNAQL
eukprot:107723_1